MLDQTTKVCSCQQLLHCIAKFYNITSTGFHWIRPVLLLLVIFAQMMAVTKETWIRTFFIMGYSFWWIFLSKQIFMFLTSFSYPFYEGTEFQYIAFSAMLYKVSQCNIYRLLIQVLSSWYKLKTVTVKKIHSWVNNDWEDIKWHLHVYFSQKKCFLKILPTIMKRKYNNEQINEHFSSWYRREMEDLIKNKQY